MNTLPDALLVDKPETYGCSLYSYMLGHRILWIEVSGETETFYLLFQQVIFFSGTTYWLGADFVVEPHETCLDFVRSADLMKTIPDWGVEIMFRLYRVRGSQPEVKILAASNVYRTDKAPSWTILPDSENEA
jgi:hypothetical protein